MSTDLITLLEKEAAAERERLLGEARNQAEEIRAAARAEAQRLVDEERQQQEAASRAARVRAQSTAQLQGQALVLKRKDQAITEVFLGATAGLEAVVRDRTRYGQILGRLIEEGAAEFGGRLLIEVHPDDVELVRSAARRHNLDTELRTAAELSGGVRLSSPDGRYVVLNTLASRLERARPTLGSAVARVLWG